MTLVLGRAPTHDMKGAYRACKAIAIAQKSRIALVQHELCRLLQRWVVTKVLLLQQTCEPRLGPIASLPFFASFWSSPSGCDF